MHLCESADSTEKQVGTAPPLPPVRRAHVGFVVLCTAVVALVGYLQMTYVLNRPATWPAMLTPTMVGLLAALLVLRAWRLHEAARNLAKQLAHANECLLQEREGLVLASEAKSRLVAHISHEIRTPLSGILGMTQVLLHGECDPATKDSLTVLNSAGEMLHRIVNEALDLSKAESGNLQLEQTPFSIVELVDVVVGLYCTQAEAKGVSLRADVSQEVPRRLEGDAVRITQILNNLVANAVKFTETGNIVLSCSVVEQNDAQVHVRFDVSDTGIGLNPQDQRRVFDPFVQQAASTARRFGGTGLGLTICRRLATAMSGQLEVQSKVGEGSTFSFSIPLSVLDAVSERPVLRSIVPPRNGQTLAAARVLVVDDETMLQRVYQRLLTSLGYSYHGALDGADAVAQCQQCSFDVVLMDFHMPRMNGPEAARRIQELKGGSGIPIVGLTGSISHEEHGECLAAGMTQVLTKPVRPQDLERVLRKLAPASVNSAS